MKKIFDKKRLENEPFFIAEVGQNHQGDIELAKKYVIDFTSRGASAVKFQMRNNKVLFSDERYNKEYNSENAFGKSYGEHREFLELSLDEFSELKTFTNENGSYFMVTPFDEPSLQTLIDIDVDIIKVASFDLGNASFLEKIVAAQKPTVMSVGGGKMEHIIPSIEQLSELEDIAVLHCVSEYPCRAENLNLQQIEQISREFPNLTVGISDHFSGILSGPLAYMHGARVFEKHVTYSHVWKGTDHAFSLLPEGFRKFVRDVKLTPLMSKKPEQETDGKEFVFEKLGKIIYAARNINAGDKIESSSLTFKISEEEGIPVRESYAIIGKTAKLDIEAGTPILHESLQ